MSTRRLPAKRYTTYIDADGEFSSGSPSITYYEIEDKTVLRQLMKIENRFVASNRKDSIQDYHLAEADFDIHDLEEFDNESLFKLCISRQYI